MNLLIDGYVGFSHHNKYHDLMHQTSEIGIVERREELPAR